MTPRRQSKRRGPMSKDAELTSTEGPLKDAILNCVDCNSRAFANAQRTIDPRWVLGLCLTCKGTIARVTFRPTDGLATSGE